LIYVDHFIREGAVAQTIIWIYLLNLENLTSFNLPWRIVLSMDHQMNLLQKQVVQ
jgi:hypothetical protein